MTERTLTHAFGLELDSVIAIDGCPAAIHRRPDAVRVDLVDGADLGAAFACGEVVARRRDPGGGGEWVADVVRHPISGYVLDEGAAGLFSVATDGGRIGCAPGPVERWRWQRHLIGRALPLAACLRGFEPWHAGAVVTHAGALVVAGPSGRGKSTLLVELLLCGARLLTDDVLALELRAGRVVGHPGAGAISVRAATAARLGADELAALGTEIGRDDDGLRIVVPRQPDPVPLSAVVLLDDGDSVPELIDAPDPRALLASTFDFVTGGAGRFIRQLEVCAAIARDVTLVRLGSGPGRDPRAAVARLTDLLSTLRAGTRP